MQTSITRKDIAKAQIGVISTPLLEQVARHARAAQTEEVSHEGATLMILCTAPLLDELLEYRRQREDALELTQPDMTNIVPIRGDAQ